MASSKVFMCGPEHSIAQPGNVLTLLHGPGVPRKWDLGSHWSWHQTCLGTAPREIPVSPQKGSQCCCRAVRAALLDCTSLTDLETLGVVCVSVLRHSPESIDWSASMLT